jgi:3-hydroxybutyrate dehydrogenase
MTTDSVLVWDAEATAVDRTAYDLSGRTALVTGAASGIGAACAQRLAADGAGLLLIDKDESVVEAARRLGGRALVLDLTDTAALAELDVTADIMVNNAGIQHVAPVEEFPPELFHRILTLMVEAPFLLLRRVLPGMYERGWGRIVHISSVHGLRASPYKSAYVTAKHATEGLSKTLALEGGPRGVTSNTVCPAYVRTPLVENQIAAQARTHDIPESDVVEKVMLTEPAIKRLIEPSEVAAAVSYLCSPAASFMNGASLVLDGGWTAR